MNYPDSIYRKFEIIEKELHGEKVYGLIEHKTTFFGLIKCKKQVYLRVNMFNENIVSIDRFDRQKWVKSRSGLEKAIRDENAMSEYYFEKREMRK